MTAADGFKRIYLDLPGHGRTPGRDWIKDWDDMLAVVREFIDTLLGEQRFILVGHSLGAYLARDVLHSRANQIDGMLMVVPAIKTIGRPSLCWTELAIFWKTKTTGCGPWSRNGCRPSGKNNGY